MRCLRRPHSAARLALLCLPLWAGAATALDYGVTGFLGLNQLYNSNIILSKPAEGVFGTSFDGNATLFARDEAWEASGKARVNEQVFYPAGGIDMTNVYLDVGGSYANSERSRWSLAGSYVNAWSLASEAQPLDVTGFILGRLRRDIGTLGPSWTYAVDELTKANVAYVYTTADYDYGGGAITRQESHTASTEWVRQLDERFSGSAELAYSHYTTSREQPQYGTTSDYVSSSLGLRYTHDDTLSFGASAGAQFTRTETDYTANALVGYRLVSLNPPRVAPVIAPVEFHSQPPSHLAPLFTLNARKTFERSELNLTYSHVISPSFNGILLETDRLGLAGTHRLAEQLTGGLGFYYYAQSYSGVSGTPSVYVDYSSYAVDTSLSWRWSERWSATASFQFMYRDAAVGISARDSEAVYLGIKYDFDTSSFR